MSISSKIKELRASIPAGITLVAVSKTYPAKAVMEAYDAGQGVFGESRPQELVEKYGQLPKDIQWHMIGHLQTNKVKYIAPFVSLIHSVDNARLIDTVNKEALKNGRIIDVLLEIRIASEDTKHGWDERELFEYLAGGSYRELGGIRFRGVMGIATYTDDEAQIRREFLHLKDIFDKLKSVYFGDSFDIVSMGMSGDYPIAIECGSTMIRVGSYIFGERR